MKLTGEPVFSLHNLLLNNTFHFHDFFPRTIDSQVSPEIAWKWDRYVIQGSFLFKCIKSDFKSNCFQINFVDNIH